MNFMRIASILIGLFISGIVALGSPGTAGALAVCAAVPDLEALAREIGGAEVQVTTFCRPGEDPHFVEPKPAFLKALSRADALLFTGMDLESAWLDPLVRNCANRRVQPGNPGYVDCSKVIRPMEVPTGTIDRSMGDIHSQGNPHYLVEPVNGYRVAVLLARVFSELRPQWKTLFSDRLAGFGRKIGEGLFGAPLAQAYPLESLLDHLDRGSLGAFLAGRKQSPPLSGWIGRTRALGRKMVLVDHNIWPYFARRFGLVVVGSLEPKPGVPPSTRHLGEVAAMVRTSGASLLLSSVYFNPKYTTFMVSKTGIRAVPMANMVGSRPGTDSYLAMIEYNVSQVLAASR